MGGASDTIELRAPKANEAIGQSEHTARGNAQVSPRVRRRNAKTCKVNGNDDCSQSEYTARGNAQVSPRVRRRNAKTCKVNGKLANENCLNHADCTNPGVEKRHSEKYGTSYDYGTSLDRTTSKRSVLKSRSAKIIDRYGNQLMRYASANKQIVTGGIAGSTREE